MSTILVSIYKTEGGVQNNPAILYVYDTNCEGNVKKSFAEVLIHWDGLAWVEDPVFVIGQSIVALKVTNPCDGMFAYLDYTYNDFRLSQLCCFNEQPEGDFIIMEDGQVILQEDEEPLIEE
jgi:hypothetical protein